MSEIAKKLLENSIDGKIITDRLGRKIRLKKPDVLDKFDLFSALGDDSKNVQCTYMAFQTLHVVTIDDQVIEPAKSFADIRFNIKRLGEEGLEAIGEFLNSIAASDSDRTEKEEIEQVKK